MFLKRLARDLVDWSAERTGRLRKREASMIGVLTVLTYHRVLPDAEARACPFPSLAMPKSWFAAQMAWVKRKARVLPLGEALVHRGDSDPLPLIAVTFDDGYADNAEIAAPILRELGLRGTFFICSGPVRDAAHFWYDSIAEGALRWGSADLKSRLIETNDALRALLGDAEGPHAIVAALKRAPDELRRAAVAHVEDRLGKGDRIYRSNVMTPGQVRALAGDGHEIGSHTVTHPILPQLDEREAARELGESKAWLEKTVGQAVAGFCYPNGDHTPATGKWVAAAGYAYACLTEEGRHAKDGDPFRIRRVDLAPNRVGSCFQNFSERSFRATLSLLRRS